jgi:O-methyltransferase/8-demethyl-8-(2,3-dimethoxy-alpha-L-rhamnosyl)tetracenomycin-C 4'-O-methyltransferase
MMPCFSQEAFQKCVDTFAKSVSGWGIDLVWPKLLGLPSDKIAIIDTVTVKHTKAMDTTNGPFYVYLRDELGVNPFLEMAHVMKQFGIEGKIQPRVLASVPRQSSPGAEPGTQTVIAIRGIYLDNMERMLIGMIYKDRSMNPWGKGVYDETARLKGRDWPVAAHTMIGLTRLHNLRQLTEAVLQNSVPGDLIETGVWRGGACILMRAILKAYECCDRRVFVADSFEGLPPPDPKYPADQGDIHHTYSELTVSIDEVKDNFAAYNLLDEQVVFLKGWFKNTLPTAPIDRLAILRLDGDMYQSTMDALTAFYHKLSSGGYCIVDDGNVPNCRAAIEDYRKWNGINDPIIDIDGWGFYWQKA